MSVITQRTHDIVKQALADKGAGNEVLAFLRGSGVAVTATSTARVGYNTFLFNTTPSGAAIVFTLPHASSCGIGTELVLVKTDAGAFAITVTAAGTDKINGAATATIAATQYKYLRLVSDGSANWYTVGSN